LQQLSGDVGEGSIMRVNSGVVVAAVAALILAGCKGAPFDPKKCAPPTYEQCAYAYDGGTQCDLAFREAAKTDPDSPCSALFSQKFDAGIASIPATTRMTVKLAGTSGLPKAPETDTDDGVHYIKADLNQNKSSGLSSMYLGRFLNAAATAPKTDAEGAAARAALLKERAEWNANGNVVASCAEYVHEKYYDYTVFEDAVTLAGFDNHRTIFNIAYGSKLGISLPSAIGLKGMKDPVLKGKDGTPFTPVLAFPKNLPKNDFFTVPMGDPILGLVAQTSPDGKDRISQVAGKAIIWLGHLHRKKVGLNGVFFEDSWLTQQIPKGLNYYQPDWKWHSDMNTRNGRTLDEQLAVFERKRAEFLDLLKTRDQTAETIAAQLGASQMPVAGKVKYQTKYWLDPLWNPDPTSLAQAAKLRVDVRDSTLGGTDGPNAQPFYVPVAVPYSNNLNPPYQSPLSIAMQSPQLLKACEGNNLICLFYRLESLDDAIEGSLHDAKDLGCLDIGPAGQTTCDWSPKTFTQQVMHMYQAEREAAFKKCMDYAPKYFAQLKTTELKLTNNDTVPPTVVDYPTHDYTTSPTELELFYTRSDEYMKVLTALVGDVVDPVTHEVRMKKESSDTYSMGGDWFGADADYAAGFEVTNFTDANTCAIGEHVYGHFNATAKALMMKMSLIAALLDVNDKHAEVHLDVLDNTVNLIDYSGDFPNLDNGTPYNLVSDSQQMNKTFVDVNTRFFIVFVPVSLGAKVSGTLGIDYSVDLGREQAPIAGDPNGCTIARAAVKGKVEPYASVDGEIYAAVDAIILEAGIKGVLNIVHAGIPLTGEVALGPHDGAHPFDLDVTMSIGATLQFVFLSGHISVYVKVGICPFCAKAEQELVGWDGLHYDIPLFHKDATFPLFALQKIAAKQGHQ
jgi:hypothetical protein